MRVLQANKYYYVKGGADRYVFALEQLLSEQGHESIPFSMHHPCNVKTPWDRFFVQQIETEHARLNWEGVRGFGHMVYSREARRQLGNLLDATNPDVCHLHNIYYQLSPSILSLLHERGIPTVMTVHDYHLVSPQHGMWSHGRVEDWGRAGLWRSTFAKFHKDSYAASFAAAFLFYLHRRMGLYRLVDRYVAPTKFMRDCLVRAGFPAEHVRVLPFGIDVRTIVPSSEDDGFVLFTGRLSEEKGAQVLVRAARELPHVRFVFVGRGPEEPRLRHMAEGLSNVTFAGFQSGEALWEFYRRARCVVVPSLFQEVFGLSALEAMAVGKPVIASHVGGLPEVVEDRLTGFLVRPGSVQEIAEAVDRLMRHPLEAQALGRAGRQRVEEVFSLERHWEGLKALYGEVIREHGRIVPL